MSKLTNNTAEVNFSDLCDTKKHKVPFFQRPYKWNRKKVVDLAKDIKEVIDKVRSSHYMGAIVCYNLEEGTFDYPPNTKQVTEIIDGQQRFTSLFITLLACIDLLLKHEGDDANVAHQKGIDFMEQFIYFSNLRSCPNIKFIPQREEQKRLTYLIENEVMHGIGSDVRSQLRSLKCNSQTVEKRGNYLNNFKAVKKYINENILNDDYSNIVDFVKVATNQLYFVNILVKDPQSGPTIYQNINSSQEKTTNAELIRNEVFRTPEIPDNTDIYEYLKDLHDSNWEPFEKSFQHGENNLLEDYLYAFAVVKNDTVTKDKTVGFYLDYWSKEGIKCPLKKIKYMEEYRDVYMSIKTGVVNNEHCLSTESRDLIEEIEALYLSRIPNVIMPYLMFTVKKYLDSGENDTGLIDILRFIVAFHVRRNIVGYEQTGLNPVFKTLIQETNQSSDYKEIVTVFNSGHRTIQLPENADIEKAIISEEVYSSKTVKYILTAYNKSLGGDSENKIQTIEHIYPRVADSEWEEKFTHNDTKFGAKILNTLPNLLPLSTPMNSRLSNGSYADKKTKYADDSMYKYTREFANDYDDWNYENYKVHAKKITEWFLIKFPDYFTLN